MADHGDKTGLRLRRCLGNEACLAQRVLVVLPLRDVGVDGHEAAIGEAAAAYRDGPPVGPRPLGRDGVVDRLGSRQRGRRLPLPRRPGRIRPRGPARAGCGPATCRVSACRAVCPIISWKRSFHSTSRNSASIIITPSLMPASVTSSRWDLASASALAAASITRSLASTARRAGGHARASSSSAAATTSTSSVVRPTKISACRSRSQRWAQRGRHRHRQTKGRGCRSRNW